MKSFLPFVMKKTSKKLYIGDNLGDIDSLHFL